MKSENITFTIECTMRKRWVPHFLSMLAYMEQLGELGSSRKVAIYSDGDGDFRPFFKVDGLLFRQFLKSVPPKVDNNGDRLYDAG